MVSPTNRDYLIRTMIGESAGQPRQGQAAVAHTIMNRRNAGRWGDSIQDVVTAPNQFEPWQTRADELWNISPESDVYQQTGQIADQVIAGDIPDPTQGGLFFLNPDIVRERRGGSLPDWAQNQTASIGGHTFYRGPGNEGNDMANGNRRRPSVYQPQPETEPGTGQRAQPQMPPGAGQPADSGRPNLPERPSQTDMAMAQALMQGAQQDARNTRGTGLGLAGALAQQAAGAYMSGQFEDEQQQYGEALGEAFSGAQSRGDLVNTMLRSGDEGLRNTALKAQLSQPKDDRTADIKNYEYYRRQTAQSGEKPLSFPEWKKQSKAPLVQMKGETKYEETRGEALANRYGELQADARKAQNRIGRLRAIDDLLSDPSVYTGTGARSINALKRAGQTLFGMDFEGVDKADTAQRFATEMALSFKEDLPGPMSDADRQFLQEIPPNIGDTAQGRKLLVDLMSQKEQRKVELGRLARQYRQENGRLDDGWYDMASQYAEENPMFDQSMMERAKEAAGTAVQRSPYSGVYPSVESDEEYDALESGEMFVDPDGQVRRKP